MKLTKFVKKITKKSLPIIFSLLLVFISSLNFSIVSEAGVGGDIADAIVNYLNSVSGAVKKTTDGITRLPQTTIDSLYQYVNQNLNGNGIYEDGNGNYVFSNDFMRGYYDRLSSDSYKDCYVVSNFSNFNDGISSEYTNLNYNSSVTNILSSAKLKISSGDYIGYICSCYQYQYNANSVSNLMRTVFQVYLLPRNFAYLSCAQSGSYSGYYAINFYDNNGTYMNVPWGQTTCQYNIVDSTFSVNEFHANDFNATSGSFKFYDDKSYMYQTSLDTLYFGFPNYSSFACVPNYNIYSPSKFTLGFWSVFASDAMILSKTVTAGNQYVSNTNNYVDYFVVNNNNLTIKKTVIQNNNWTNIYNNYVTNVNNEYKQGSNLTKKDIQKIMKKYTDALLQSIMDGIEDLGEHIENVSQWLEKISMQIDDVNAYLEEIKDSLSNGTGGSDSAWTEQDVTRVLQILERFYLYSDDYLNKLSDIDENTDNVEEEVRLCRTAITSLQNYLSTWESDLNSLHYIQEATTETAVNSESIISNLATVSTALDTIIRKIDSLGNKNIKVPTVDPSVVDDIKTLTDGKLEQLASVVSVIGTILQATVPFCFLALVGGAINALSADPVSPEWDIPIGGESVTPLFGEMTIDLSLFDSIHELWEKLMVILFVFGLVVLSFDVFKVFGVLMN